MLKKDLKYGKVWVSNMKMEQIPAYELIKREELSDIRSTGYLLRHKKTGARICVIENDDENKVFNIAFRTPAPDSTGVPHIMEHSVLCGSKNFPVKDPFVELVKGSLNTFLNAMTYPDRTMYPLASLNQKDFQNLMHVYLDGVFYPNIYEKEEIFCQEGWSYQIHDREEEITINGVVYNEMKGAFSSPDGILSREILAALYPDISYRNESGGNPENIPDLSYEEFLNFHRTYYHPSNSFLYLYGDLDMEEKLNWIDREYLEKFDKISMDTRAGEQKPFESLHEIRKEYPISEAEDEDTQAYLSYNIGVGNSLNRELNLAGSILEYALISAPGAPLKKALVEAGIGTDVYGSFESDMKYSFFSVVSKNAKESQKEEFMRIIEDTMRQMAENGIDEKALEAALNYQEFQYREADFGRYPKGLMIGLDIYSDWNYEEEDIFFSVKQNELFAEFRKRLKEDRFESSSGKKGYFERILEKYFLENAHKALVLLVPKKGLLAKKEEEQKQKLREYKNSLSEAGIQNLIERTKKIEEFKDAPARKEEMEKIPMLSREDIKKEAAPYYLKEKRAGDITVLHHELFTNGIDYLTFVFKANWMPEELIPYMGLLKNVLGYIDTEHYEYGDLYNEINRRSGGIQYGITIYGNRQKKMGGTLTFEIKAKAMVKEQKFIFDMIREVLFSSKVSDTKRLKEIIAELKSRMQASIVASGHTTALVRGLSYISMVQYYSDLTSGIGFYQFIDELDRHFEEKKEEIVQKLSDVIQQLFTPTNLLVSITADDEGYQPIPDLVAEFQKALYPANGEKIEPHIPLKKKQEGFKTSSQVQYVARVGNFMDKGYEYTGALKILSVIMNYEYMWVNIRVKGGAYGCMSGFFRNGDSYFVSYRDPNLEATNEVYEGIPEFIETFTVNERDMTKYIIGTISDIDTPLTPKAKGARSLGAYMMGVTYEMLQKERDEILSATEETIRGLAPRIRSVLEENIICAVGNEDKIETSLLFLNKINLFECEK